MPTKKPLVTALTLFLLIPLTSAQEQKCGLTNLATCIPQKLYEYTLSIINAPLQPFLTLNKTLLSAPVNVQPFMPIWAIIIYIISLFYGIFLLIAGFNLMISGYSYEKRENAKEWLKNIILMIIFVQASFFLYSLIIEISSGLTAGVINLIDQNFFLLTVDNITNIALQLILALPYLLILLVTLIFLSLRYLIVAAGVVFFPIGLFFNFIPFLKSYGKLILNFLMVAIFLPFFQSLILLFGSLLVKQPVFQNVKIIVAIVTFFLVDLVFIFLTIFVIVKASFAVINSDIGRATSAVVSKIPVPLPSDKSQQSLNKYL